MLLPNVQQVFKLSEMKNKILTFSMLLVFAFNMNAQTRIDAYKVGKRTSKLFFSRGVVLLLEDELQYKCLGSNKEAKDETLSYTNIVSVEKKKMPLLIYSTYVVIKMSNGESKVFKVAKSKLFVTDLASRIAK